MHNQITSTFTSISRKVLAAAAIGAAAVAFIGAAPACRAGRAGTALGHDHASRPREVGGEDALGAACNTRMEIVLFT